MKKISLKSILVIFLVINFIVNPITNAQNTPHSAIQINRISEFAPYAQNYEGLLPHQIKGEPECKVRLEDLQRGAPKDGIMSIDNPNFVGPNHETAPQDPKEKVLGVVVNGTARAYPYNILDWHEIINDDFNGNKVSITYCPLTGSGIVFPTDVINNTELGTSGLLFENNLVFYERDTGTHWTQMDTFRIKGAASKLASINYTETVETTWETWLKLHPDTEVLSTRSGSIDIKSYDRYPYGNYQTDRSIFFSSSFNRDIEPYNLYHEKELTHIIQIDDRTLLIPFEELSKIPVLNHNFESRDLFTIFIESENMVITYSANVNGKTLNFTSYEDKLNLFSSDLTLDLPLFIDNFDNIWNLNGLAISGPLIGTQLDSIPTYNAYWFAAITFFPNESILIIENDELEITTTEIIETQTSDGLTTEITKTLTSVVHSSFSVDPTIRDQGSLPLSPFFIMALLTITIVRYKKHKNILG